MKCSIMLSIMLSILLIRENIINLASETEKPILLVNFGWIVELVKLIDCLYL